ncbi:hypothetical protein, partial [Mycobacterium intracellulare]|uniref:hypothetical protein n=1 Tax=Mycobacterium intracellulare TaxID=1767 RepID=UPI001A96D0ED
AARDVGDRHAAETDLVVRSFSGGTSGAAAGMFGSKLTASSAWAVADGMVTSVPVTAASMSVLRTFCNIFPFAARAPKQAHAGGPKVLA